MAKFNPRLTAPSYSDKNWIHYSADGYNYCIKIDGNSCLPNCVGYAWGRWRELLGAYHKLSRNNAEVWYTNTSDGYERGQEPKVGAIACWEGLGNLAGHVAPVEQVNSDGSFITSNSGYKSTRFWTQKIKKPYSIGSNYKFQGFIYPPITFEEESQTKPIQQNFKYNVGDKVVFNGVLYVDARGNGAGQSRSNLVCTITKRAEGSKPYNIENGLGWVAEEDLQLYTEKNTNELKVGDTVKITGKGSAQADGGGAIAGGIGWTRTIIKTSPDSKHPYCVGTGSTATGWYPASSLQKL